MRKKIMALLLAVFMGVSVVGCAGNEPNKASASNTEVSEDEMDALVKVDDFELKAVPGEPDKNGAVYAEYTVENNSEYTLTKWAAVAVRKDNGGNFAFSTFEELKAGETSKANYVLVANNSEKGEFEVQEYIYTVKDSDNKEYKVVYDVKTASYHVVENN